MKYNGLPVYKAKIKDKDDGILAISLVDYPAVEKDFVCFNKDSKIQNFSIDNEEEHIITGVIMLANTPIYRVGISGYEYYLEFDKETIKQMAAKMLNDGTFKNNDIQHNYQFINGLELVELYIKDSSKGINPNFVDVPDGSLMASYHVTDDALWDEVKNGDFLNGFSLSGAFDIVEEDEYNNKRNNNTSMSNILTKLMKSLVKFSEISTDKGVILIQDGDELAVGVDVYVTDENGEWIAAADGEYKLDDERIVVVADGKVSEIREVEKEEPAEEVEEIVETEEAPAEEVVPAPEERDEKQEQIDALKEEIAALKAEIEELKARLAEIVQEPAAEPIETEFEKVVERKEINTKNLGSQKKAATLFANMK